MPTGNWLPILSGIYNAHWSRKSLGGEKGAPAWTLASQPLPGS